MYEESKTRLTLEMDENIYSFESKKSLPFDELITAFYGLCITATFTPKTVLEGMMNFAQENADNL